MLAGAGRQDLEIAVELGISNQKAARWRKRFLATGLSGLEKDAPRPGRTPSIPAATVQRVIRLTTQHPILFAGVVDRVAVLLPQPAGDRNQQQSKRVKGPAHWHTIEAKTIVTDSAS